MTRYQSYLWVWNQIGEQASRLPGYRIAHVVPTNKVAGGVTTFGGKVWDGEPVFLVVMEAKETR